MNKVKKSPTINPIAMAKKTSFFMFGQYHRQNEVSCQGWQRDVIIQFMEITYLGHSSFRLKGKTATVVTDPFKSEFVGLKFPKTDADIVTVSHNHSDHNFVSAVEGAPFIISDPGEYELKGISVFGYSWFHDQKSGAERGENIIYMIEMDGLQVCHLGDIGADLPANLLDEIGASDILMIPVGGSVTIDSGKAVSLVQQLEPSIVLPMHYKASGMKDIFKDLEPVDAFLTKAGIPVEKLDKLIISKDKLSEEIKAVLLDRKDG